MCVGALCDLHLSNVILRHMVRALFPTMPGGYVPSDRNRLMNPHCGSWGVGAPRGNPDDLCSSILDVVADAVCIVMTGFPALRSSLAGSKNAASIGTAAESSGRPTGQMVCPATVAEASTMGCLYCKEVWSGVVI
jgi:hypothetical protein